MTGAGRPLSSPGDAVVGAATGDVRPAVENLELVVSCLCTVVDRSVVVGRLGKVVRMFGRSVRTWSLEGEGARCVVSWGSILICWSLGGRVAGSSLSSSRGLNWLGLDWLGRGGLGLDWLGLAWLGLGGVAALFGWKLWARERLRLTAVRLIRAAATEASAITVVVLGVVALTGKSGTTLLGASLTAARSMAGPRSTS